MPPDDQALDLYTTDDIPLVANGGPGSRRAAAVILALGPELAGTVFRHFDEEAVRALAVGAKALRSEPASFVTKSLEQFGDAMYGHGTDLVAGDSLLKDMLRAALGDEAAYKAFRRPEPPPPDANEILGPLAKASVEDLALILGKEHPQTVALVLSAMETERATKILTKLSDDERTRIIHRIARVESISPDVLRDVVESLASELEPMAAVGGRQELNGRSAAIELIRRFPMNEQSECMDELEEIDPELADELRAKLFTFQDCSRLSDRDVQTLLKEVDVKILTLALKGSTEATRDKIIANMSRRVAQMLLDDLEMMGPVRLSEVEQAQEEIARVAAELAEDGRITITGGDEELL